MSNGVEVIVAGPTPALRWENSNPQPTLTLSDAVVMLLPQDKPNEFVTKTCTTTFTYLSTITKDGTTTVSTEQQVFTRGYTYTFSNGTPTAAMSIKINLPIAIVSPGSIIRQMSMDFPDYLQRSICTNQIPEACVLFCKRF